MGGWGFLSIDFLHFCLKNVDLFENRISQLGYGQTGEESNANWNLRPAW